MLQVLSRQRVLRSALRTNVKLLLVSLILAASWRFAVAQDAAQPAQPQFEVAAIKRSADAAPRLGIGVAPGGRMTVRGVPVRFMIRFAYNVQDFQISGGPPWMNTDAYDVDAKAPENVNLQQIRPHLQTLLQDRFRLAAHREKKEVPAYDLILAKGGTKIVPSAEGSCVTPDPRNPPKPDAPPHFCGSTGVRRNLIEAYGVSMDRFVATLSGVLGRPVIDKTGIEYKVNVHLEFAPDQVSSGLPPAPGEAAAPPTDPSGSSILTAIQEQLGLKLASTRVSADALVIDQLERPSEN